MRMSRFSAKYSLEYMEVSIFAMGSQPCNVVFSVIRAKANRDNSVPGLEHVALNMVLKLQLEVN